jgi:hypothetical protein
MGWRPTRPLTPIVGHELRGPAARGRAPCESHRLFIGLLFCKLSILPKARAEDNLPSSSNSDARRAALHSPPVHKGSGSGGVVLCAG